MTVDPTTGEILCEDVSSWRSTKQDEAYRRIKKLEQNHFKIDKNQRAFTVTYMDAIKDLWEETTLNNTLNSKDFGYFLVLTTYVNYDNVLFPSRQSLTPMNKADIGRALDVVYWASLKRVVEKFVENDLLREIDYEITEGKFVPAYQVNEKYHYRGKTQDKEFIKSFNTAVRTLYKNVKPADLGFIYALLPYVHFDNNVICRNPYEKDATKIDTLSVNDIAEITGLSRQNVLKKRNSLEFDGMVVLKKEVLTRNQQYFRLNPYVFYRQAGEPPKGLRDGFLIKGK